VVVLLQAPSASAISTAENTTEYFMRVPSRLFDENRPPEQVGGDLMLR
jgi:hypothetical protein